ncbi:MAG TPA: ATP-binding protein, partial [Polyangiaceae bacterium]|nr:ATP-binding protein [Polyangiaceae bacterium]
LLCAGMELDLGLAKQCGSAQGDAELSYPTFALAMTLFDDPAWEAMSPERPLRYWRLLEMTALSATQPFVTQPLRVDERIVSAIKGLHYLDERLAALFQPLGSRNAGARLPASQAQVVEAAKQAVAVDSRHGRMPVLQLLGTDGPSKQAVAVGVSNALGVALYRLAAELLPTAPADLDVLARLWQRENLLLPVALYLDANEAERVSPTEGMGASVLRFIGRCQGLCFLDARDPWPGLGAGTTPALSLEVRKPTPLEQRQAWTSQLGDAEGGADLSLRLASQFNLGLGDIAAAASSSAQGDASGREARLWKACLGRTRPRLDQLAQRLDAKATWDDIVLPESEVALLRQIAAQVRVRGRVYDDWGFRDRMNRGLGINALFAGESGTGKTMAAEVIANEVRLDLYRIDLSAVVSKYIGETEKNLRRMFDAAEDGGALLFFDEADALFGKRSEVKDSHDRYANIEINYLLQRMEAYSGLAVLATNMKSALDQAFMRRLRFVVNFPIPGVAERRRMWQRVFPSRVALSGIDYDRLARLNLTGGSILNVALNAAFIAAERASAVTMPLVLEAARVEFKKLDRLVNEADFTWKPAAVRPEA